MGRPLRQFAAAKYWFVTDRCHDEQYLLRPDPETLAIVADTLRDAIAETHVALLAYVIMGNHWHLLVRIGEDPESLARFMQQLKSDVAKALNEHHGRHGTFWADRYHAIPVRDEASVIERMTYILMNPVAAGLSATVAEYPGLSSLEANVGIRPACGAVDVPIELPPQWVDLDRAQLKDRRRGLRDELRRREELLRVERIGRGLPRPKAERCTRLDPFARPTRPARRPAPRCFAATVEAKRAFDELRRAFVAAYRWASDTFRSGDLFVAFPAGSFPPPLVRPPVVAA